MKQACTKTIRIIAVIFSFTFISSCGGSSSGGDSSNSENNQASTADSRNFMIGSVDSQNDATYLVTLYDAVNASKFVVSDNSGVFSTNTTGMSPPLLIKAERMSGTTTLYSYANEIGYVNVNRITDDVVRTAWNLDASSSTNQFLPRNIAVGNSIRVPSPTSLRRATEIKLSELEADFLFSGLSADEVDLFRSKYESNGLGYDAVLNRLDNPIATEGEPDEVAVGVVNRVISNFITVNNEGVVKPNYEKFTLTTFNEFFEAILERGVDYGFTRPLSRNDGLTLLTDTTRGISKSIATDLILKSFIEVFSDKMDLRAEDRLFLNEAADAFTSHSLLRAVSAMYLGLQGEDTSRIYAPLEKAMEDSFLGPDRIIESGRATNRFLISSARSMSCRFPLLYAGGSADCGTVAQVGEQQETAVLDSVFSNGFRVTDVIPKPGLQSNTSIVSSQSIAIEYSDPVYQGLIDEGGLSPASVAVYTSETSIGAYCDNFKFLDSRSIQCSFDTTFFRPNKTYIVAFEAQSISSQEIVSSTLKFSIPDYQFNAPDIDPPSGEYIEKISISSNYVGPYSIRVAEGVEGSLGILSPDLTVDGPIESASTSVYSFALFDGARQVSETVNRLYQFPTEVETLAPPMDVVFSVITEGSDLTEGVEDLLVSWTPVDNATGYAVYLNDEGPPNKQDPNTTRSTTQSWANVLRIPDVQAGVTYSVMIATIKDGAEGTTSSIVSRTANTVPTEPVQVPISPDTFDVGNLTVPLNYPTPDTDTVEGKNLRNTLFWYLNNQNEQLFIAECTTREATKDEKEEGDPTDWFNVIVSLGNVGVSLDAPIMISMKACIGVASRMASGSTLKDAVTKIHCGTEFNSAPNNLAVQFKDDFDFDGLCETPPVFGLPAAEPEQPPENNQVDDFVPNVPRLSTETDAGLRNSIAWYEANRDSNLYSIECATRRANGVVVGNTIVDKGLVVDTKTGITVADSIGWNAVSTFLSNNGVGLHENIQRSILGCNFILNVVETYDTYDEALEAAKDTGWDDFVDFR